MSEATPPHRTTRIELACGRGRDLGVTFSRKLAAADKPASIAVSARGGDFVLPPRKGKPILGYNDIEMEDRFARVPIALFEAAAAGEAIELTEAPDISTLDKPPRKVKLSTAGLKGARSWESDAEQPASAPERRRAPNYQRRLSGSFGQAGGLVSRALHNASLASSFSSGARGHAVRKLRCGIGDAVRRRGTSMAI